MLLLVVSRWRILVCIFSMIDGGDTAYSYRTFCTLTYIEIDPLHTFGQNIFIWLAIHQVKKYVYSFWRSFIVSERKSEFPGIHLILRYIFKNTMKWQHWLNKIINNGYNRLLLYYMLLGIYVIKFATVSRGILNHSSFTAITRSGIYKHKGINVVSVFSFRPSHNHSNEF